LNHAPLPCTPVPGRYFPSDCYSRAARQATDHGVAQPIADVVAALYKVLTVVLVLAMCRALARFRSRRVAPGMGRVWGPSFFLARLGFPLWRRCRCALARAASPFHWRRFNVFRQPIVRSGRPLPNGRGRLWRGPANQRAVESSLAPGAVGRRASVAHAGSSHISYLGRGAMRLVAQRRLGCAKKDGDRRRLARFDTAGANGACASRLFWGDCRLRNRASRKRRRWCQVSAAS
jgi:hypothetical protein